MKLIIDIPDDLYKTKLSLPDYMSGVMEKIVQNGTPLEQIRKEISLLKDHEQTDTHTVTLYTWKHMQEKVLQIIDKYAKGESE